MTCDYTAYCLHCFQEYGRRHYPREGSLAHRTVFLFPRRTAKAAIIDTETGEKRYFEIERLGEPRTYWDWNFTKKMVWRMEWELAKNRETANVYRSGGRPTPPTTSSSTTPSSVTVDLS